MDLLCETEEGVTSSILNVKPLATVLYLKLKITLSTGIPINHQILTFNGILLENDATLESYSIVKDSLLKLRIRNPYRGNLFRRMVNILLRFIEPPSASSLRVSLGDSVLQIKERIHETHRLPVDKIRLYIDGTRHSMQNAKTLSDYGLTDGSVLRVTTTPIFTEQSHTNPIFTEQLFSTRLSKIKIRVVTSSIFLRVCPDCKVEELRGLLEERKEWLRFELSPDYFFIHNNAVLDDKKSFSSNEVKDGDEIELKNGNAHLLIQQLLESGDAHVHSCSCSAP